MAKNDNTYELGIVNAGAVSGGAYGAGVLDFLFEALEEWEKCRSTGGVPNHRVVIKALAGTSAGAIGNALAAIHPWHPIEPVRDLVDARGHGQSDPKKNPAWARNELYRTWVQDIDIAQMLDPSDIARRRSALSLLNSDPLTDIAEKLIDRLHNASRLAQPRPYIAEELDIYFCVTNTRGVRYIIDMIDGDPALRGHGMVTHEDYLAFKLSGLGQGAAGNRVADEPHIRLGPPKDGVDNWRLLAAAALASSAFPIGLAARPVTVPGTSYDQRLFVMPADPRQDNSCTKPGRIKPAETMPEDYRYWAMDGGVGNNEPLEFARRSLSGIGGRNPRSGEEADRAVLMIDPFPDEDPLPSFGLQPSLIENAKKLLSLSVANTRFKAEELALAVDETVYSRFLIAPTRKDNGKKIVGRRAIAGGGLAGFSAFLDARFRMHDFQLGRRNCKQFLRKHLTVKATNPLVKDWATKNNIHGDVPLIPLCGTAAQDVAPFPWPRLSDRLSERLADAVRQRAEPLVDQVLQELDLGFLVELMAEPFLVDKVVDTVEKQLDGFQKEWGL